MPTAGGGGATSVASANIVDGTITNIDINNAAGIAYSKLNLASSIVDTDILPSVLRRAEVSLTAVEIKALHTTPKTLIAAPGAGKIIIVDEIIFSFTAGTQYANGDQLTCRYNGDTTNIIVGPTASFINSASSGIQSAYPAVAPQFLIGTNTAFELKLLSATAYITGTGTLKLFIKYRILTL